MSAVLTQEFRTNNLLSFINNFFGIIPNDQMHLFFGKDTSWPNDVLGNTETDIGFSVPVPNTFTVADEFRPNAIAGVKVLNTDVSPVIPRINWELSQSYEAGTVVITDEWNVYMAKTAVASDTKPTHYNYQDANPSWQFLYKITEPNLFVKFVTDEWIPVYWPNYQGGGDSVPHPDSAYLARCVTMMINRTVSEVDLSLEDLNEFRQLALWSSVKDTSGVVLEQGSILPETFDENSGRILYVDNRIPIYRTANQSEEYKILVGF
jgi:hypothetical protein